MKKLERLTNQNYCVKILNKLSVNFAVLGTEESCTGEPAKRAGNEFLFQVQAVSNIEVMNAYGIKKIYIFFMIGFMLVCCSALYLHRIASHISAFVGPTVYGRF